MENGSFRIRPVKEEDLGSICGFAAEVGPGFTSLPNDSQVIKGKIDRSLSSFALKNEKNSRFFFFVLETMPARQVVGTAAIEVSVSYTSPFFNYKVENITQVCQPLSKYMNHKILWLENNYQEASVLCTLYLSPSQRGGGQGAFLSRSRCLFISQFPDLISDFLIAEMRGVFDEKGVSPFWEGLGRYFFDMEFHNANYLLATQGSQFVSDLMPTHPIYVTLLDEEAQKVIGQAHPKTLPALHVLEKEGFMYRDTIDIFDGGPILEIPKKWLKTGQENKLMKIQKIEKEISQGPLMMLSNTRMDFRATLGKVTVADDHNIVIEENVAKSLEVSEGDEVRYCVFRDQQ